MLRQPSLYLQRSWNVTEIQSSLCCFYFHVSVYGSHLIYWLMILAMKTEILCLILRHKWYYNNSTVCGYKKLEGHRLLAKLAIEKHKGHSCDHFNKHFTAFNIPTCWKISSSNWTLPNILELIWRVRSSQKLLLWTYIFCYCSSNFTPILMK